jgi:hypothetical protein
MAKGQKKSNKEVRKPKADKKTAPASASPFIVTLGQEVAGRRTAGSPSGREDRWPSPADVRRVGLTARRRGSPAMWKPMT